VATLWDILAPQVGPTVVEAPIQQLLEAVPTSATRLTDQPQVIGSADRAAVWRVVCELLPTPGSETAPFLEDIPVRARLAEPSGWEVTVDLPAAAVEVAGAVPGKFVPGPGGQVVVADPAAGSVLLRLPATGLRIASSSGSDVSAELGAVSAVLDPPVLALPAGFGVQVGELHVGPEGVDLANAAFFMPVLPALPSGPIPCPVRFGRAARSLGGVFAVSGPIALSGAGHPDATIRITVDRPTAHSLLDLIPSMVAFEVALGGPHAVPGVGSVTARTTGGAALAMAGTISLSSSGARLEAALTGGGGKGGLARLSAEGDAGLATRLAIAAALGPYLPVDGDGEAAALAALVGSAAGLSRFVVRPEETEVTLHGVTIRAQWAGEAPPSAGVEVALDYESQLAFAFSAGGIGVSTKRDRPYRVRHRDVRLVPGTVPSLSWRGASTTVISFGDWQVTGIPSELLRVADVRVGGGSVLLEFDLRLALELGPVTVDRATLRVALDQSDAKVDLEGFGVTLEIPGTVEGRGLLEFRDGRIDAALDVRLPSLGASGRGAVAREGDMILVGIGAELFVPIPFANSGLGLYGFGGQLATDAQPLLPASADPIQQALDWKPHDPRSWAPGSNRYLGFGVSVGTVPDLGFALKAEGSLLIGLPDPSLRLSVRAWLMRGLAGTLLGVVIVDDKQVTVGVRGEYEIPVLLKVIVPAGATFPTRDLGAWSARMGGDRGDDRGEPVLAQILPDLLGDDLEAWAFLMAFGRANTVVGEAVAGPPGQPVSGLSLAFGAGFDVDWSAGPFSFSAGGVILAALTHRPSPDGEAGPWILNGRAELHGSVDLGPVSIGASAELNATVDPAARVFFARAEACASIDLWLTSIEGCVHIELGDPPSGPAPPPGFPLQRIALTDRLGVVMAEASATAVEAPTVWPDTVPVLVFDTWVDQAQPLPGIGRVIGDNTPSDDGWVGSESLAYRFELTEVHVWEVDHAGRETEIGGDWMAAWQLPLYADVYGAGGVPARARSLALNHLDLHHWLQSATVLPAAPGNPVHVLPGLCGGGPGPGRLWFRAERAIVPPTRPMSFRVTPGTAGEGDPTSAAVLVTGFHTEMVVDELLAAAAQAASGPAGGPLAYHPPGVEELHEPFDAEDQRLTHVCWLPHLAEKDMRWEVALRLDRPARDVVVHLATLEEDAVSVGHQGPRWEGVVSNNWGRLLIWEWRSPPGEVITEFDVHARTEHQVGVLGFSLISDRAAARAEENERHRRRTHETLETAAGLIGTRRRMLRPGRRHRVEVVLRWESRGSLFGVDSGDERRSFWFATAPKQLRPAPGPPTGPATTLKDLMAQSVLAMRRFDQSVLEDADMGRYLGAFVPPPGTTDHFLQDPAQVEFVVDHLRELAAVYDSCLTVSARRIDAPRGTPRDRTAPVVMSLPAPPPVATGSSPAPLGLGVLTALDRGRLELAVAQDADETACRFPRPGGAVRLGLEPLAGYEVTVTVDAAPGGVRPPFPGRGAVIGRSRLRTSRYADALGLFADLGLVEGAAGREVAGFPVTGLLTDGAAGFDAMLEQLGLGGYRAPSASRAAALWHSGPVQWSLIGVLLESPEPMDRPGRLDVRHVRIGGQQGTLHWDARRTRLLATVQPTPPAPGTRIEVTIEDRPPRQRSRTHVVGAAVAPTPPGSTVMWQ
jgi:hypothetical protein